MSTRKKPELMPWLDYLMYADPLLPYLELFKLLAQAAYYALGGDDVDAALDQARISVDEWVAARHKEAQPGPKGGPQPIANREAASARIALAKQGESKRRLFERGCETVARLFFDVFKRSIYDRREPEHRDPEAPPPPGVDPAIVETIRARAANFLVMPTLRDRHAVRADFAPFDEMEYARMTAQAVREREAEVERMRGVSTAPARDEGARPAGEWLSPLAEAAAERKPTDIEISAYCLALAEGADDAVQDMPEDSQEQLKALQKWFAGYNTGNAPRAAVAMFVRRKFEQAFGLTLLTEAAKRSITRLITTGA